jgi:sigma-B regulation protein RsbU (phosphoserine phosphatase)
MNPGDSFFVYTDGVPEATNPELELYGTKRLLTSLNHEPDATAQKLIENVKGDIDTFVNEADQFDDITMLSFIYHGLGE